MNQADTFRCAASLVLLRPALQGGYEFLLLHKPRRRDAWQLPQGGMELGETVTQCAVRELQEEAGITDVRILGESARTYEYRFPASYRRFRPDHICGQRISFAYGVTSADVAVQEDGVEINDHRWIRIGQIGKYVRREEYRSIVRAVYDEAVRAAKEL